MFVLSHLFVLVVLCQCRDVSSSIDGPSSTDTPIRLSKRQPATTPQRWELHKDLSGEPQYKPSKNIQSQINQSHENPLVAKAEIVEPPGKSYIAGKGFLVKLRINIPPSQEERFQTAYNHDGHICLSLDDGPLFCWSVIGEVKMYFADVTDGQHTLIAKLYKDGEIQDATVSAIVNFTMVHNPEFAEGVDFHLQEHYEKPTEDVDEQKANDKNEKVEVIFPVVDLVNPANRVSYAGNSISMKTNLEPQDPEIFQMFFLHGFICFNIDFATAYACYSIYNYDANPLVLGLDIGMHTISAALINPETGDILKESMGGRTTFFMAGKSFEGAQFVADINVRGRLHKVPLIPGASLREQSKHLCSSIGNEGTLDCIEAIKMHLFQAARQQNISFDD
jgi:hypothetical protein